MYHNKFKRFVCFKKDVRILFAINIKYQLMTLVHIVILNRGGGGQKIVISDHLAIKRRMVYKQKTILY